MLPFLRLISIVLLIWFSQNQLFAQDSYPFKEGQGVKYELIIELPKVYVSGILVMVKKTDDTIDASIINEFGVSLMDFTYNEKKNKVKIHSVMKMLDKWYIKKMLKQDLKSVLSTMREGNGDSYTNRHNIKYQFTLFHEVER